MKNLPLTLTASFVLTLLPVHGFSDTRCPKVIADRETGKFYSGRQARGAFKCFATRRTARRAGFRNITILPKRTRFFGRWEGTLTLHQNSCASFYSPDPSIEFSVNVGGNVSGTVVGVNGTVAGAAWPPDQFSAARSGAGLYEFGGETFSFQSDVCGVHIFPWRENLAFSEVPEEGNLTAQVIYTQTNLCVDDAPCRLVWRGSAEKQ